MREFQHIQLENEQRSQTLIQPSLEIGKEDDEHEVEANAVADKVMKMSDPEEGKKKMQMMTDEGSETLQRMEEDEEEKVQMMKEEEEVQMMRDEPLSIRRKANGSESGMEAPENVEEGISRSKGNGQSLSTDLQEELGGKMNADFSSVKVHTDDNAVQMNKEVGAKAFTHGNDVYFNKGQYDPASNHGKHLLAHELTHTIQQNSGVQRKIQKQNGGGGLKAGKAMVSAGTTSVKKMAEGNVVPLPCLRGSIFGLKKELKLIYVFNLRGELVKTFNAVNTNGDTFVLDKALPNGLYLLNFVMKDGTDETEKIIKMESIWDNDDKPDDHKIWIVGYGTEHSSGPTIKTTSIPLVKNGIKASPGEKLIFGNLSSEDKDKKRTSEHSAWNEYTGVGPYQSTYVVSADAEFNSVGSGKTDKVVSGIDAANVYLYIDSAWTGTPITVTLTIKDMVPDPTGTEHGSAKDIDYVETWVIEKRSSAAACPTGMTKKIGPAAATWTDVTNGTGVDFGYQAAPDIRVGQPDYENQTFLEEFDPPKAFSFSMTDLSPTWKAANPGATTADKAAAKIFSSGNNGTFVWDKNDMAYDKHNGFGDVTPFLQSALADANGFGYTLAQRYVCAGTTFATCTIDRRATGTYNANTKVGTVTGLSIRKSDPV